MLDKFNKKINSIIFESYELSPKFIDKDFQGSFNNIDLFTSKKFFKGIPSETFITQEFIQSLIERLNIKNIKKEISLIIYISKLSFVYTGIILPTPGKRIEIILMNSWKSEKIPPLEITGQKRIIL